MLSIFPLFPCSLLILMVVAGWMVYAKAGEPGWAVLIPFYNIIVLLRMAGRPWWWLLLMLIPLVGFIFGIMVSIDLAKTFGKGAGFGVGMAFLGFIFYPILAFGDARYLGPSHHG